MLSQDAALLTAYKLMCLMFVTQNEPQL